MTATLFHFCNNFSPTINFLTFQIFPRTSFSKLAHPNNMLWYFYIDHLTNLSVLIWSILNFFVVI